MAESQRLGEAERGAIVIEGSIEREEDHGLVVPEPIGEKSSRQIQIRLLPVELTVGLE